jgi:thiol-disulfide isomerase/thioredoxin
LAELANPAAVKQVVQQSPARLRVLNIWATWCAPCVAEMGDLQKISEEFPQVELIGVSLDDALPGDRAETKQKVARFLQQRKIRFRNFYFTGRETDLAEDLKFDGGLPMTFIFDAHGSEIAHVKGMIDRKDLASRLNTFLKGKKP